MRRYFTSLAIVVWSASVWVTGCTPALQSELVQPEQGRSNQPEMQDKPYVILVSIDGYRYDYTEKYAPPTLTRLRNEGASATAILPVYPSKTFTNHYSIATGLYAEHHGIVANEFYDSAFQAVFRLGNRKAVEDGRWYGGTPIWVAAEKQGMLAANYFWPGSEADIQGIRPSYFMKYNQNTPNEERVDHVIDWLKLPVARRPHFVTLYFSDVDTAGHHYGPDSEEVKKAVWKVDRAIDHLLNRIQEQLKPAQLPVNVIVLSDHGMQKMELDKILYLEDFADLTGVRVLGDGLQISLYVEEPSNKDRVYQELKKNAKHFQVYLREELPKRYHYASHPRCGDIILVVKPPYYIALKKKRSTMSLGSHGYDPDTTPNMQGIFYAQGPQIKPKQKVNVFRNIHVYPFILKILGLKVITPIDGDPQVLEPIYQDGS